MRALWRPPPPAPDNTVFPTAAHWAGGLQWLRARYGTAGQGHCQPEWSSARRPSSAELLSSWAAFERRFTATCRTKIPSADGAPWLAIDPKGLVGEAEYEVGALIRNPLLRLLALPDVTATLPGCFDVLAETLSFDRQRVIAWSYAQALLSAWWHIEDHGHGWEPTISLAERLAPPLNT